VTIPEDVGAFRAQHRERHIGPGYRGWLHFGTTTVGAMAAIVVAIVMVDAPSAAELAAVPISFFIANLGEYLGTAARCITAAAAWRSSTSGTRASITASTRTTRWPPSHRATSRWCSSRR
jgi:hypothetical protein